MKTRILPLATIILMSCLGISLQGFCSTVPTTTNGPSPSYVVGVSPYLNKAEKDIVFRQILVWMLEDMPLGSALGVYDAYQLQTITRVEIPTVAAFRSAKTRANQFKTEINKLKSFLATDHPRPSGTRLNFDQSLRLPQFLDFVGEIHPHTEMPVVLVLLGGPLYLDPKEPGFSMVDGYFPSDGHLLATREESVYGRQPRSELPAGSIVHWGYFGDPWVSDVHQEKIRRFWTYYLQGRGARLATFCGDLPTVFEAAHSGADSPGGRDARPELDSAQTKLEMLRVTRDVGATDWITRDTVPNLSQVPPTTTVGPMKIGIRWKGDIDLDLYARPEAGAETLFFQHMRSPQGYYFKDHRSSPQREFEFIEFESPVDVRQVDARVNFYEGTASEGAGGEIRIEFDGRIYSGRFSLAAHRGNEGRTGARQGEYWTSIDVPGLLKLSDTRRTELASPRP